MSNTLEMLKDLLHMTGMAMSSGRHMPSVAMLDRESYERILDQRKRYESNRLIRRLKEQELIKIKEKGQTVVITITDKAVCRLLKQDIKTGATFLPGKKVCLVSFDIPEHVRDSRDVLRRFLKEADFDQVHRSVWRSKYDVIKPLKELIETLEIGDWVKIYLSEEI